jgi:hypothetical protein
MMIVWLALFILPFSAYAPTETQPTDPTIGTEPSDPILVMYDELLSFKHEYIEETIKERVEERREEVRLYIARLRALRAKLFKGGEEYKNLVPCIDEKIESLLMIEALYTSDYEALLAAEQEAALWEKRLEEYPVATKVWLYLSEELGYSDEICAGIIGNMMTECGGQTLNLDWAATNKGSGCYGLCQWHPRYYKEIQGADLDTQLEFIATSFPDILSRYLSIWYKKGFTYEDFLAMKDPGEVAYAFCVTYERPGPGSHAQRRANAVKAYEYFTSEWEGFLMAQLLLKL